MTMIADNRILIVLAVLMAAALVWWLWGRRLAVPTEKPDATLDKVPPVKTVAVEAPVKADIKPATKKVIVSKAKTTINVLFIIRLAQKLNRANVRKDAKLPTKAATPNPQR